MKEKVLVILCGVSMNDCRNENNLKNLKLKIDKLRNNFEVEIACVSSNNDFGLYNRILNFNYTMVDKEKQYSKISNFIQKHGNNWDIYIKVRPELFFHDDISLDNIRKNTVYARARKYSGPEHMFNGSVVGGPGDWECHGHEITYSEHEEYLYLDDHYYIFRKDVVDNGGFIHRNDGMPHSESYHTERWLEVGIELKIIGIDITYIQGSIICRSGNVNC